MTKVQLTFHFSRRLEEADFVSISRLHSVYGFFAVRLDSSGEALLVEYDASRLSPKEVRAAMEQHGLPLTSPAAPASDTTVAS